MGHIDCDCFNNENCFLFNEQHLETFGQETRCRREFPSGAFQKGSTMRDGVF